MSKDLFVKSDWLIGAYTAAHAATNYILGKGLGKVWAPMKPFADPRLVLATSLMQTLVMGLFDRQDEEHQNPKLLVVSLFGSNLAVLGAFHFAGTKLGPKAIAISTLFSTGIALVGASCVNKLN